MVGGKRNRSHDFHLIVLKPWVLVYTFTHLSFLPNLGFQRVSCATCCAFPSRLCLALWLAEGACVCAYWYPCGEAFDRLSQPSPYCGFDLWPRFWIRMGNPV